MNRERDDTAGVRFLLRTLWVNRALTRQMISREIHGRYQGSLGGLFWSLLNPVLMLVVYTFVFSVIFKARWGTDSTTHSHFGIILFVGLLIHGFIAETLNRAPGLVVGNANFVKKVVFPLQILSVVSIGSALFHLFVNVIVLLLGMLLLRGFIPVTAFLFPLVLAPLILLALGSSWIVASLSVFIRDIGQLMLLFTSLLLFLSPVFFPLSAVPERARPWIMANPLTLVIEASRDVLIWGKLPNWPALAAYWIVAALVAWIGFVWFQKTRKGFADVL